MALGSGSEFQRGRKKPLALLGASPGDVSAAQIFGQHRFKPGLQARLRLLQRDVLLKPAEDLHPARAAIEHRGESRNSLGRHDSRNPERWNLAHVDAMKCRRCNPDNRHGVLVHQHLSADDIRRASQLVLPEVVGEHNHGAGTGRLVIIGGQEPAERGAHSE